MLERHRRLDRNQSLATARERFRTRDKARRTQKKGGSTESYLLFAYSRQADPFAAGEETQQGCHHPLLANDYLKHSICCESGRSVTYCETDGQLFFVAYSR